MSKITDLDTFPIFTYLCVAFIMAGGPLATLKQGQSASRGEGGSPDPAVVMQPLTEGDDPMSPKNKAPLTHAHALKLALALAYAHPHVLSTTLVLTHAHAYTYTYTPTPYMPT